MGYLPSMSVFILLTVGKGSIVTVVLSDSPLPQTLGQKITAFQSQAKPVPPHAGAVLSCCLPNAQARLNVRACSDPVGMQSWGGDLIISGLSISWLFTLEEGEQGKEEWMEADALQHLRAFTI